MPFALLRLLYRERDLFLFRIVCVDQLKLRRARSINPLREKRVHVRVRRFLDRLRQVRGHHVLATVHFQVVLQPRVERVLSKLPAQHVQHPSALSVGVAVEFLRLIKVVAHDRLVVQRVISKPLPGLFPAVIIRGVFSKVRFRPNRLHERGKSFVQPDVAPILGGHQVTEPLMPQFMRNQGVLVLLVFRRQFRMAQRVRRIGGGAGIFHAASNEFIHHCLRIFFPGILNTQFLAEEFDHRRRPAVIRAQPVPAIPWRVVRHRNIPPRILHFHKLARDHGD